MCSNTPRFSYGCPETAVWGGPACRTGGRREVVRAGWVLRVGIPGWVLGRAIPVYYPATAREVPMRNCTQEQLAAGCKGVLGPSPGLSVRRRGRLPVPTLRARSVPMGPPWYWDPWNAASGPITARFQVNSHKVRQNGEVSPKYVDKASHSPCF